MSAPTDLAYTLPEDWLDRVTSFTPSGPAAPFVRTLQETADIHGTTALLLERVQEFALSACGFLEDYVFAGHKNILGRLKDAAASSWPIEFPLEERKSTKKKNLSALASDLNAIEGEWLGLFHAVQKGYIPVPLRRGRGTEDWLIKRNSDSVFMEVKRKDALGSTRQLMTWALKGLSLLPEARFLLDYEWSNTIADDARHPELVRFCGQLVKDLPLLREALSRLGCEEESQVGGLRIENLGHEGFQIGLKDDDSDIAITGEKTQTPGFFSPGGTEAAWTPMTLGPEEETSLRKIMGRLGIRRQARSRKNPTLFVIMWPVPWTWESAYHLPWAQDAWNKISSELELPAAALWPFGDFGAKEQPWIPNELALREFRDHTELFTPFEIP